MSGMSALVQSAISGWPYWSVNVLPYWVAAIAATATIVHFFNR